MAIDEDTRATIMRLWRAEGWPVGTIARHCGVHHSTVTRVLRGSGVDRPPRRALIDDFVPFIKRQLADNADLPGQHAVQAGSGTGLSRRRGSLPPCPARAWAQTCQAARAVDPDALPARRTGASRLG